MTASYTVHQRKIRRGETSDLIFESWLKQLLLLFKDNLLLTQVFPCPLKVTLHHQRLRGRSAKLSQQLFLTWNVNREQTSRTANMWCCKSHEITSSIPSSNNYANTALYCYHEIQRIQNLYHYLQFMVTSTEYGDKTPRPQKRFYSVFCVTSLC